MTIIIGTIISTVIFLLLTIRINFNNVKKEANKSKENKVDLIQNKSKEPSKDRYKEDLKIAFTSWNFWKLFILVILMIFLPLLITSSNRVVGDKFGIETKVIQINVSIAGFLGAATTPIVGYLYDKSSMRPIYIPLGIVMGITGTLFITSIAIKNNVLFCY